MSIKKTIVLLFLFLLIGRLPLLAQQPQVPQLSQFVTDQTATLTADEITNLSKVLKTFEDSTSNQLVVLMISTLDGYPLEDFAYETAVKNKIGTKESKNGVLILVVKNDKKVRIEVGYGLEGPLPDAIANSIIRNEMIPHFKNGDYYSGIGAGVVSVIKATAGEYKAKPKKGRKGGSGFGGIAALIMGLLFAFIIPRISRRRGMYFGGGGFGGFGGGGFGGGGFGGGGSSDGGGFGGFSGGGGDFGGGGSSGSW